MLRMYAKTDSFDDRSQNIYPRTYRFSVTSENKERIGIEIADILEESLASSVRIAWEEYISTVIEPVGWEAIWKIEEMKSPNQRVSKEYLVKVIEVSLDNLEASILVTQSLSSPEDYKLLNRNTMASLIDLHPIVNEDTEEEFLKTAYSLFLLRLFYTYIWRPWDEEEDEPFVNLYFWKRFNFFCDIETDKLSETIVYKYKEIIGNIHELNKELKSIENSNSSDSESDIDPTTVVDHLTIKMKLNKIKQELEILQDPTLQIYYFDVIKRRKETNLCDIMIISEIFTMAKLKNIPIDENAKLQFFTKVSTAFNQIGSEMKIFILPGSYSCEEFDWIDFNVEIEGSKETKRVILKDMFKGDIFLNFNARNISLANINIESFSKKDSLILVHKGQVILENCLIDAKHSRVGIMTFPSSCLTLVNCTIRNAQETCLLIGVENKVVIRDCVFENCPGPFIKFKQSENKTFVTLNNVKFHESVKKSISIDGKDYNGSLNYILDQLQRVSWLCVTYSELNESLNDSNKI